MLLAERLDHFLRHYLEYGDLTISYDMCHDRYDITWETPAAHGTPCIIHASMSKMTVCIYARRAALETADVMLLEFQHRYPDYSVLFVKQSDFDFRAFDFL